MMLSEAEFGTGGYYELVIDLGHPGERLAHAVDALWGHPDLAVMRGANDERVVPSGTAWRHGHAHLPNGADVPCRTFAEVIEDRHGKTAYAILAIPMSALERAWAKQRAHNPDEGLDPASRGEIENWLAEIGSEVNRSVPFKAAYIGFLPFPIGEDEMADVLFARAVPQERCLAYLYRLGGELKYFPTNRWS